MLTAIHCVAHCTNLATSNKTKNFQYAKFIDVLVNGIANNFSSSSNRIDALKELQEEFNCEVIKMQHIFEIRWLSRHGCLAKICKSFDALLVALEKEREDLYALLSTFEYMYAIHFLIDILQKVTDLSLRFQKEYVDVTIIHGIVASTVLCIKDEYFEEQTLDSNVAQRGDGGYPIIPEYGVDRILRSLLRGDMLYCQKIIRDVEGMDLTNTLDFQLKYAKKLCACLEKRFVDNFVMHCIKILAIPQE